MNTKYYISKNPIHPGEILREEYLEDMNISGYRLAKETGMDSMRVNSLLREKRSITADTAIRLAKFFNTSPMYWMNLQAHYDLAMCAKEAKEKMIYK